MNIQLDDGRGYVYQWETGRFVRLVDFTSCDKVYFSNPESDEAYVVSTMSSDGVLKAQIPNELLQLDKKIKLYCNGLDDGGRYIQLDAVIPLVPRQRPANYVYEPTETMTFEGVLEEMNRIKDATDVLRDEVSDMCDETSEMKDDVSEMKSDVSGMKDEVTQMKSDVGGYKDASAKSATDAKSSEDLAERYAKGTVDGVAVTSGEGYQDNAKYYKEQAEKAVEDGVAAFDQNAVNKTSTFDQNASDKTNDFNENAVDQTSVFNQNASQKETELEGALDSHTADKKSELNTHVSGTLEPALDAYTTEKKGELDDYVTDTSKPDLDSYTTTKKGEVNDQTTANIQQIQQALSNALAAIGQNDDSGARGAAITAIAEALTDALSAIGQNDTSGARGDAIASIDNKAASVNQALDEKLSDANETIDEKVSSVSDSATIAVNKAKEASDSASDADASANLAQKWATNPEDSVVEGSEFSAKHYAAKAGANADSANTKAGEAAQSAQNASNSAIEANGAKMDAISAKTDAVTAKGQAEDARDAAQEARQAAEDARDEAQEIVGVSLTPDRTLVSSSEGKFTASSVTTTELGALSGIQGNVQTRLTSVEDKTGQATSGKAGILKLYTSSDVVPEDADDATISVTLIKQLFTTVSELINQCYGKNSNIIPPDDLVKTIGDITHRFADIFANAINGLAITRPSSGGTYIPTVGSDGVMEIEKYIDFHLVGSSADYDRRMSLNDSKQLELDGEFKATKVWGAVAN